jgi:hypothetical protein
MTKLLHELVAQIKAINQLLKSDIKLTPDEGARESSPPSSTTLRRLS